MTTVVCCVHATYASSFGSGETSPVFFGGVCVNESAASPAIFCWPCLRGAHLVLDASSWILWLLF